MNKISVIYDQDPIAWGSYQAELLKNGRWLELDIEHLIEELTGMGVSESNELENRLTILLAHLLKWQFQYYTLSEKWQEFDGRSWRRTIIEQRSRIKKRLQKSPGLKSKLNDIVQEAYIDAIELASEESQLPYTTFPSVCPYSWEQIMNKDFYP